MHRSSKREKNAGTVKVSSRRGYVQRKVGKPLHKTGLQEEMIQMNIELKPEVNGKLSEIARECNLPLEKACEIILSEFAKIEGGRIYVGRWKEGAGLRFVVQWPFFTGIVRLKGEELAEIGVKSR